MTRPDLDALQALLDKNPHDGTDAAQARLLGMSGSREAALIAERDTLAAIVRAADAIRTVYATDGCERLNCTKAREYDSARAKVKP